jgi:phosphopantetheinyl transferase
MKGHDETASRPPLLQKLAASPAIPLPGLMVFLISQRNAQAVSDPLQDLLDSDEKDRSTEFATWALRHRYVSGRAALRNILSMIEGGAVPATDWRFGFSTNGKPYVKAPKSTICSFNISYAEDLIAIAVSKEVEVGVDIELGHAIPRDVLPWHLFSINEQQILRATPAENFTSVFLRFWTLKEAIAKRTGQGFATEFREIDTTAMPVVDGLQAVGHDAKPGALLFHMERPIGDETLFLSVSTSPIGRSHDVVTG